MDKDRTATMSEDGQIKKALDRLYRYNRLKELEAPEDIIEQGRKLVEISKQRLNPAQWAEVESRLPGYMVFSEARDKRDMAWRDRCLSCTEWKGYEYLFDTEPDDRWCGEYRILDITSPKPCPKYKVKN